VGHIQLASNLNLNNNCFFVSGRQNVNEERASRRFIINGVTCDECAQLDQRSYRQQKEARIASRARPRCPLRHFSAAIVVLIAWLERIS
jgi:hypothetical protein